ncbi:MAG: dihydroneopterin aldolase [Bacteroidota bacterium]
MGTIALENMEFFANHGYYIEEQKIGNRYSVDLYIQVDFSEAAQSDQLKGTINYEKLYQIVAEVMAIPTRLLEHIAQKVINTTLREFAAITHVKVSVAKHNPPIGGLCGLSKVVLEQERPPR